MTDVMLDERAPDSDAEDETEAEQQTMEPELDLPQYHGRTPVSMLTKVGGTGGRVTRSHDMGERVVFLVEAHLEDAGHKRRKKEGLTYVEKYVADDVIELGPEGLELLLAKRQEYRVAADARSGQGSLLSGPARSLTPKVFWVDETGHVLDDDELAYVRGVAPAETDEERDARLQAEEDAAAAAEAAGDAEAHADVLAPRWLRAVEDGDAVGYDQLTVEQIRTSLPHVDSVDGLKALITFEAANRNRKAVRGMFDARMAQLTEGGF